MKQTLFSILSISLLSLAHGIFSPNQADIYMDFTEFKNTHSKHYDYQEEVYRFAVYT